MVYFHRIHGTGIFTYMNGCFCMVNVGKYTSPMDLMGIYQFTWKNERLEHNCHGGFIQIFLCKWVIF